VIQDDFRLKAVLPTIRYCLDNGGRVVLLAHRGRPDGKNNAALSNEVLAPYFTRALGEKVLFYPEMPHFVVAHKIILLENLRFSKGEEQNSQSFARLFTQFGDVYVNDAFAVSHRAHASLDALPRLMPHAAGFNLLQEVRELLPLRNDPDAPYAVVMGGAKAEDKLPIVWDLMDSVDYFLFGGLLAITYLAAMGQPTGAHDIDSKEVDFARKCIRRMHEHGIELCVPSDYVNQDGQVRAMRSMAPHDLMLDIGPETTKQFAQMLHKANVVFWNGAMGKFEDARFAAGTVGVARAIQASGADVRIASGGDTSSAIHTHQLADAFTYISTGGGATLEFIAGRDLPGLTVLEQV
jgi:phosphoglycerate kinase